MVSCALRGAHPVGDVLDRKAEHGERDDVRARPHRQRDVRPRSTELARDLGSRVADAHQEHAATGVAGRSAVLDAVRQAAAVPLLSRETRHLGIRHDARRDHEGAGRQVPAIRGHDPPAILTPDTRHLTPGLHGKPEPLRVLPEVLPEPLPRDERGVRPWEGEARQTRHQLPGVELERVVGVGPAVSRGISLFEHDVRDAPLGELLRGRETGRAGPDHDDRMGPHAASRDAASCVTPSATRSASAMIVT